MQSEPVGIENPPVFTYILAKRSPCGEARMIRFLFLFLLFALCAYVLMQIVRSARAARIDWTGISFIVGFIVLAFWLRHVTGLG
jgi:hypothetical protein